MSSITSDCNNKHTSTLLTFFVLFSIRTFFFLSKVNVWLVIHVCRANNLTEQNNVAAFFPYDGLESSTKWPFPCSVFCLCLLSNLCSHGWFCTTLLLPFVTQDPFCLHNLPPLRVFSSSYLNSDNYKHRPQKWIRRIGHWLNWDLQSDRSWTCFWMLLRYCTFRGRELFCFHIFRDWTEWNA